jgi:hypothetical protein
MTSFSTGQFLGDPRSPNITVVDTPGFKVMTRILSRILANILRIQLTLIGSAGGKGKETCQNPEIVRILALFSDL